MTFHHHLLSLNDICLNKHIFFNQVPGPDIPLSYYCFLGTACCKDIGLALFLSPEENSHRIISTLNQSITETWGKQSSAIT